MHISVFVFGVNIVDFHCNIFVCIQPVFLAIFQLIFKVSQVIFRLYVSVVCDMSLYLVFDVIKMKFLVLVS